MCDVRVKLPQLVLEQPMDRGGSCEAYSLETIFWKEGIACVWCARRGWLPGMADGDGTLRQGTRRSGRWIITPAPAVAQQTSSKL